MENDVESSYSINQNFLATGEMQSRIAWNQLP